MILLVQSSKLGKTNLALTGVAQWTGHLPANQGVAGSILLRARAWVAGQAPSWWLARSRRSMFLLCVNVSSLPLPLSKNK